MEKFPHFVAVQFTFLPRQPLAGATRSKSLDVPKRAHRATMATPRAGTMAGLRALGLPLRRRKTSICGVENEDVQRKYGEVMVSPVRDTGSVWETNQ